jgi:hypothetical protein
MQTLIDPFELNAPYFPPPARAPMATLSIDIEMDAEMFAARDSVPDEGRESWSRVRCWCSED